jgi:hypothetical protein
MYSCLNDYGKKRNLITDQTKFPCPSLVQQNTPNFYNYDLLDTNQSQTSYNNREYYTPFKEDKKINNKTLVSSIPQLKKETGVSSKPNVNKFLLPGSTNNNNGLLPVLDTNFNLREICKQCILLEDHLTQKEKRCVDCCIKHFLAIEALSEEALSLDKDKQVFDKIEDLPNKIRKIQKKWIENKENSHECSQMLRSIRKSLMEDSFPIIFESKKSCDGNKCKI